MPKSFTMWYRCSCGQVFSKSISGETEDIQDENIAEAMDCPKCELKGPGNISAYNSESEAKTG